MKWIKASDKLPIGTVVAKHIEHGICEMNIHNDKAIVNGYNFHCLYPFDDSELYEYEWLDESPTSTPTAHTEELSRKDAPENKNIKSEHEITAIAESQCPDFIKGDDRLNWIDGAKSMAYYLLQVKHPAQNT